MLERERLWMTHRRKLDIDYCPLCFSPVYWIYDGMVWIPCDREPVLLYLGCGTKRAVVKRELLTDCRLYQEGAISGALPVSGHVPHVFTCEELKR